MIRRILSILKARNIEFIRDRASMAWAIGMPFGLVFAMGFIFSGADADQFNIGLMAGSPSSHAFLETRYVNFLPMDDFTDGLKQVERHQIDLLVDLTEPVRYWVNPESPGGYVAERVLLQADPGANREPVSGDAIRYVDWVVPGILGMNMMFSSLFGVGYVVVRYRKNGFLKRLRATPLSAFEFISAQAISRLLLTILVQAGVFLSIRALLDIRMDGSYFALLLVGLLGCSAMIALALVFAARVSSEELAGGIVNLIGFPMVLLSGVFYSIEGSPEWLQKTAEFLPLTQMLEAARAVMLDGAGLGDIIPQLAFLAILTIGFLAVGAATFKWRFT